MDDTQPLPPPHDEADPASSLARRLRVHFSPLRLAMFTTICVLGTVLVFVVSVRTAAGQRLDEVAMLGGGLGRTISEETASPILNAISLAVVAAAIAVVAGVAIVRRRIWVALSAIVVIAGANLTTQVLKKLVLERPDLGQVGPDLSGNPALNSFPSGHTTVASSIALALLMVVSPRPRAVVALLGICYTLATGLSTVVMGWHRPSDVIGAILVSGAWAGAIMLLAGVFDGRTSGTTGTVAGATLTLTTGGILLGAIGAVIAFQVGRLLPPGPYSPLLPFPHEDAGMAFLATSLVMAGASAFVFGAVLGLVSGSRPTLRGAPGM